MLRVKELISKESRLYIIDGNAFQRSQRTGTYVLIGDEITLIETGTSPSVQYILEGLKLLEIAPEMIKNIIVTHVHLDHAGAAGLMMKYCTNATLFVHPRGARHMINPYKLIKGTKLIYGDSFDQFFIPIVNVPENRIHTVKDGETLKISRNRILTFYDTPGHATHHISIYDSLTNGIFTGDTMGVYYNELNRFGVELYIPATSPPQFQLEEMLESQERIKNMGVDHIYFGHYGMSSNIFEVYRQIRDHLSIFIESGKEVLKYESNLEIASKQVTFLLFEKLQTNLIKQGIPQTNSFFKEVLKPDLYMCAMGIVTYLAEQDKA
ncbi:MBL fold metallo-hydrolase [Bacillus cereus]|uniref:MBL fold metallo-hydrolase n=1 Tax=Bacillus cereus TaxID=1396 RepID=UPI000C28C370|nr:MBL fold metallo-hydrolase [Bacillus cereus]